MHPMDNYTSKLTVVAKADCPDCHGEGWLPVKIPVHCSCVEMQIPLDLDDEVLVMVVPAAKCVDPVEDAIEKIEDVDYDIDA